MDARCFSNGTIKVVDSKGKEYPNDLPEVMKRPNWFQDQKEFMRQTKLFHDIYGNEYIYGLFPVGFDWSRTKALFSLPPNIITQEYNDTQAFFTHATEPEGVKYYLETDGEKKPLDGRQIIHMNDNNVTIKSATDKNLLAGESKMKGLRAAIRNIKMAYESRGVILKHRGALGILSNQSTDGVGSSLPMDQTEIDDIQEKYRQYGGLDGQNQIIISSANLRWQQMTVNPDKLGLFQETEEDFNKILDGYGVPSEMFVRQKGSTYENQKQAERGMYERTTIPAANEWIMGINDRFFPDSEKKMIVSYDHLQIFQEDIKAKSEVINTRVNALSRMLMDQAITLDEYREELSKLGVTGGKPMPPKTVTEDNSATLQAQANLRGSVGGVQGVLAVQASVSAGTTTYEAALSILTIIYGFTDEQARQILGQPTDTPTQANEGTGGQSQSQPFRRN